MSGETQMPDTVQNHQSVVYADKDLARRKSQVRVLVTYFAALYVFIGAIILIIGALVCDDITAAKDVFLSVLPIATGVITYWFADRSRGKKPHSD